MKKNRRHNMNKYQVFIDVFILLLNAVYNWWSTKNKKEKGEMADSIIQKAVYLRAGRAQALKDQYGGKLPDDIQKALYNEVQAEILLGLQAAGIKIPISRLRKAIEGALKEIKQTLPPTNEPAA